MAQTTRNGIAAQAGSETVFVKSHRFFFSVQGDWVSLSVSSNDSSSLEISSLGAEMYFADKAMV
jgi:hypothetical protein